MSYNNLIIILLVSTYLYAIPQKCKGQDVGISCVVVDTDKYVNAYLGWPYSMGCSFISGYLNYDVENLEDVVCEIRFGNGTIINNFTTTDEYIYNLSDEDDLQYIIPSVQEETPEEYQLILNVTRAGICYVGHLRLNISALPQQTCAEFVEDRIAPKKRKTSVGSTRNVECQVDDDEYPKAFKVPGLTMSWVRNCTQPLPDGVEETADNNILIRRVNFTHAGYYVCAAKFNNMTRYIAYLKVCVNDPLSQTRHVLECSKTTLYQNPGEGDAVFRCTGDFGDGQGTKSKIIINWFKVGSGKRPTRCVEEGKSTANNETVQCTFKFEEKCYLYDVESVSAKPFQIPIKLTIRNIDSNDYGKYVIAALTNLGGTFIVNRTLTLRPNPKPALLGTAAVVGISIGVVCFVILLIAILLYYRVFVRVYYKRVFGVCITDNRIYGAFLTYNFSQDIDTFAKEDIKTSIPAIREILEKMGYKVYDERKDGFNEQNRAENIRASVENSHRVVVVLTLDFIKDGWSMLALQKGFNEMIQSGSKLIFVLLPGIKEYLKQHSKDDKTCRVIQRAVKLNYAIRWSKERRNTKRFLFEFEDAMPKLGPSSYNQTKYSSKMIPESVEISNGNYGRSVSKESQISQAELLEHAM